MREQYNADYVKAYFQRARELGDTEFVRMWVHASGLLPIPDSADPPPQLDSLVIEWYNMRPWNRQGVLFLMARELEKIASKVAMDAASRARELEPI